MMCLVPLGQLTGSVSPVCSLERSLPQSPNTSDSQDTVILPVGPAEKRQRLDLEAKQVRRDVSVLFSGVSQSELYCGGCSDELVVIC